MNRIALLKIKFLSLNASDEAWATFRMLCRCVCRASPRCFDLPKPLLRFSLDPLNFDIATTSLCEGWQAPHDRHEDWLVSGNVFSIGPRGTVLVFGRATTALKSGHCDLKNSSNRSNSLK